MTLARYWPRKTRIIMVGVWTIRGGRCKVSFHFEIWGYVWFSIESTGYPKQENRGKIVKTGRIQGILLNGVATSSFNNYLSSDSYLFTIICLDQEEKKKSFALRACPRTQLEATAIWGCGH